MHTPETCAALDCATAAGPFHTIAPVERLCYCPDDCGCHYPWRATVCGCKGHKL